MRTGYFCQPVYVEYIEMCFPHFPWRAAADVSAALGENPVSDSVLGAHAPGDLDRRDSILNR